MPHGARNPKSLFAVLISGALGKGNRYHDDIRATVADIPDSPVGDARGRLSATTSVAPTPFWCVRPVCCVYGRVINARADRRERALAADNLLRFERCYAREPAKSRIHP